MTHSRIDMRPNQDLKDLYLRIEIRYVKDRLNHQSIIDGYWCNNHGKVRPVMVDEMRAYNAIQSGLK